MEVLPTVLHAPETQQFIPLDRETEMTQTKKRKLTQEDHAEQCISSQSQQSYKLKTFLKQILPLVISCECDRICESQCAPLGDELLLLSVKALNGCYWSKLVLYQLSNRCNYGKFCDLFSVKQFSTQFFQNYCQVYSTLPRHLNTQLRLDDFKSIISHLPVEDIWKLMSVQQNINWQQVDDEQLLWELRSLISKRYHKRQDVSESAWQSIADAAYNITAFLYQKGNQIVIEDPYNTTLDSVFDVKYVLYLSKKMLPYYAETELLELGLKVENRQVLQDYMNHFWPLCERDIIEDYEFTMHQSDFLGYDEINPQYAQRIVKNLMVGFKRQYERGLIKL
ncbi:hypothetical protein MIR68_001887 [Amoeboaphelidium protococcarum]|nr:hypothetical protein MIR68_001887 [Amoeboaphelidium protococcarum]